MNWIDDKGMEEGYSLNFIILIIVMSFLISLFLTDYYKIYMIKHQVDKEIKRTVSEVTIQEVKDVYSVDRKATVYDIYNMKSRIEQETRTRVKNKFNLELKNISTEVTENEKVFVKLDASVDIEPITGMGKIKIPVKVKGRSKAQRFDVEPSTGSFQVPTY